MTKDITEIVVDMKEANISMADLIQEMNELTLKAHHPTGNREHIAICIPIYREITCESFAAFMQLYSHLNKNYVVSFSSGIATYLHEARHLIVKNLYEIHKKQPIDYVMWVDSDNTYKVEDFEKALQTMKRKRIPFLSGLYLTKRTIANKPVYMIWDGKDYRLADNYPQEECLIQVDAVGFGFFLCEGHALFDLYERHPNDLFMLDKKYNHLVGEDIVFSEWATKTGYPLFVHTGLLIGHEGAAIYPKDFKTRNTKETLEKIQWEEINPL